DSLLEHDLFRKPASPFRDHALIAEDLLDLSAESRRDVLAFQCVRYVGGQKSDLGAAIEASALELQAVERLCLRQLDHGVGQLDFAAGAALLLGEKIEDFWLQDIAPSEDEIRRRAIGRRLFDHAGDREHLAAALADADHAVLIDALMRHF